MYFFILQTAAIYKQSVEKLTSNNDKVDVFTRLVPLLICQNKNQKKFVSLEVKLTVDMQTITTGDKFTL